MTLPWYVARLFVSAWTSITLFLAVLFNFIEFFEKLARIKQVSIGHVLHFLGLNFLPSAFDVMPVSAWLATLFVLRELTMQQSWDFLQLIGFIPRRLSLLLVMLAVGLAFGTGLLRELFILEIAQEAEQYKYAHFKKQQHDIIFATWFELEDNRFCYVEELDLARHTGKGLQLVTLNQQHDVASVTNAARFTLDQTSFTLLLEQAVTVELPEQGVAHEPELRVPSRYFFNIMGTKQRVYNIVNLYKALLFSAYLPKSTTQVLWRRLIDNLWYYFSFISYPALTIYAFSLPFGLFGRWAWALGPYPMMTMLGLVLKMLLTARDGWGWILVVLILLIVLFFIKNRGWRPSTPSKIFKS